MQPVEIKLDHYAEPSEIEAVEAVARRAGIACEVTGGYRKPQPGLEFGEADEPEWIILIIVSSTFGAFFARFFGEAGADAWRELKAFVERLRDSRRRPTGQKIPPSPPHSGAIHFQDQYGNTIQEGVYPTRPSDQFWEGWQRISEPDWSQLDGWFVYWDDTREAWAAFEPLGAGDRHLYWDREASMWAEIPHDDPHSSS